jgi:hypothetical protein
MNLRSHEPPHADPNEPNAGETPTTPRDVQSDVTKR